MSQMDVIVKNIKKFGFMYEDDVIDYFTRTNDGRIKINPKTGKPIVFDKGLMVARVKKINENPQKYGFPVGMGIGSRPFKVDGYVKRIWTTVFTDEFVHVDGRFAKGMKEWYTK